MLLDLLMGEYHLDLRTAFYHYPMALALAHQAAAAERRGQKMTGPDFAERAGDEAVENLKHAPK